MDSIRNVCLAFLMKVLEHRASVLEREFAEPLFEMIFNCMSECEDVEGNDEENAPYQSAEALLDSLSSFFENTYVKLILYYD